MKAVNVGIVTFLVITCVALSIFSRPASAVDRLGSNWSGCEYSDCSWKFEWRRQNANSNVFNAYWRHRQNGNVQGQITISLNGNSVTVSRPSIAGGPPCTYRGTYYNRDVHNGRPARVNGTYTCGSYTGPWQATIR